MSAMRLVHVGGGAGVSNEDKRKETRLTFAQGYADGFAGRDRKDNVEPYREGYDEGREDRARADLPHRRRKR